MRTKRWGFGRIKDVLCCKLARLLMKEREEGGGRGRGCFAASEGISLAGDWILISLSNRDNLDNKGEYYIRAKMPG